MNLLIFLKIICFKNLVRHYEVINDMNGGLDADKCA